MVNDVIGKQERLEQMGIEHETKPLIKMGVDTDLILLASIAVSLHKISKEMEAKNMK